MGMTDTVTITQKYTSHTQTWELRPCPFCGSVDLKVVSPECYVTYVECNGCYAKGSFLGADCADKWNERAS